MSASKEIKNSSGSSDIFSFIEGIYPKIFHNNPTPQSLSQKSDRKLVDVNKAWEKFTGFTKEEVIGYSIEELNLISSNQANSIFKGLKINKILASHEIQIKRKDGDLAYGIATFQFIVVGKNEFIISSILDISDLKKSERKLFIANNFSDRLLDSMFEALIILDADLTCIKVNTAYCELTGFRPEEVEGTKAPFPHWPPEQYDTIKNYVKERLNGVSDRAELTMKKANGDRFEVAITSIKITNEKNEIIGYVSTAVDISERIKYQNELKEKSKKSEQKKDAILKLAGLIGGDLKDIFTEITRLTSKIMQIERVSIWKFAGKESELICKSASNAKEEKNYSDLKFKVHKCLEYFNYLYEDKTIRVDDVFTDKRTECFARDYLKPFGITSTLDVLIQGNYGNYGVLCIEHIGPKKQWTIEDEEFATTIANVISLAVESDERHDAEIKLLASNEKLLELNSELKKLKKSLEQENNYLREEIGLVFNYEEMVYGSKAFSQVLTDVEQVAVTNATVLLLGESGTGKELLARAIHNISPRKNRPLIKVNCAAIPRELIESELFGHKKGSFTGAIADKLGKFQLADGGTLFLDEIGELPLEMQPKLLRAIQESEVEPVGGTKTQKVDIRIIAATNRDLEKEIKEKNFREDLFFRINVFPITIPPLRERIEDIPILIEHFVNKYSKLYNKNIKYISEATKSNLQSYPWPGNIRELENLIERAMILSNDEKLVIPNFKSSTKEALISSTVLSLEDVQRIHIKKILKECNWKIDGPEGAAILLQIHPSTLRDRMKKLHIEKDQ